jgi:two-component system KDP operon response regulator KdpE
MTQLRPLFLVIDDEAAIRRAVRNLFSESARIIEAGSGTAGIDLAAAQHPDLVLLDLALPDVDGAAVCQELRRWMTAPIVVVSARHSEAEKVRLLDAGADDYITKPFDPAELRARVRAVLRRSTGVPGDSRIRVGEIAIDIAARQVTRGGVPVHLTPTEWDVLRELMSHAGRTLTHQQLFRAVWSGRVAGDAQQYLRVHVAALRRKLEIDSLRPRYIMTEPGVGYRFSGLDESPT